MRSCDARPVVVLQARTSSVRLPGKVLMDFHGLPLVVHCAKRLSSRGHRVVVATSDCSSDDTLVKVLEKYNVNVYRGSLNNVLSRFHKVVTAESMAHSTIIIRATADNPAPDGELVEEIFKRASGTQNYVTSSHPKSYLPIGLSLEGFSVNSLMAAYDKAKSTHEQEHVTPFIKENEKCVYITNKTFGILPRKDIWTIDTQLQYEKMLRRWGAKNMELTTSWRQLL